MIPRIRFVRTFALIIAFILVNWRPATAQEWLCDPAFEDCYTPLLNAVQAETVGIDIALYWIELGELANVIISRHQAGVPVRITVEPRASLKFPLNQNTKLMVFVKNLQLMEGEPVYSVVVNLRDANNKTFDVLAESVRPVANTDFVQVIFRLPNNLAVGTCTVKVKAHGQITNAGTMRIRI